MEECYFLACSLLLAQPAFVCHSEPPAWGGTTQSGLGHSTLTVNQAHVLQTSLREIGWRHCSQFRFLCPDNPGLC